MIRLDRGCAVVAGFALWAVATSSLFADQPAKGRADDLLNAVVARPAWLEGDAPFDLDAYFRMPPAADNAAEIELRALTEFSVELAAFLSPAGDPAGLERLRGRDRRLNDFLVQVDQHAAQVDRAALDELLAEYGTGFRLLAEAQKRPQCVYATRLGADVLLPHVQATRAVARVVSLRTFRNVEKGNLDAVIADVATILRLSRDLNRRGGFINQLVSAAIARYALHDAVSRMLPSPRLTTAQCDKLLKVLVEHEKKLIDGYAEGTKTEYLMQRSVLRELAGRPDAPDPAANDSARKNLAEVLTQVSQQSNGEVAVPASVLELFKKGPIATQPTEYAATLKALSDTTAGELADLRRPYAERAAHVSARQAAFPSGTLTAQVIRALRGQGGNLLDALENRKAYERSVKALVAARRWQLSKRANPIDLAEACKAAGIGAVPQDPFAAGPLKMSVVDGRLVVYSVARDGKDDGGKIDSRGAPQPGDILVSVPATAAAAPKRKRPL